MHISEGVLSTPVLISGTLISLTGTMIGLKKMDHEKVMTTSLLVAAFFIASLIHVPVGPGSVHLILNGLMGLILGWAAFPAILVSLLLQTLLFQFGGIFVLGVNVFILATPAVLGHYLFRLLSSKSAHLNKIAYFACGSLTVLFSTFLTALALTTTDEGFLKPAYILAGTHIPVILIEGVITMFTISFIQKVQPEILKMHK